FITNDKIPTNTGLRDTICYEYRDYKGCYNSDCKPVRLNPNPIVLLDTGTYCQRAGIITLDKLVIKPFIKSGATQTFRCITVPPGSGVDPNSIVFPLPTFPITTGLDPGMEGENQKTGDYEIEYCFKDVLTGCQTCDTTLVTVVRLPEIQFSALPKQCINNPLLELYSFVRDRNTGRRFPKGYWSAVEFGGSRDMSNPNTANKINNSVQNQKRFNPSYGPGQFLLKLTDTSSGCPVMDSAEIIVNGLPLIQIDVPDTVCSITTPFTLNNTNPSGTVGTWSGPGVTGRQFDPSFSPKTKQYEGKYMLKFEYTNPLTGCTASDSQSLLVQTNPELIISTPSPYQLCENTPFSLEATRNWAQFSDWTTNGDGSFVKADDLNTVYNHGNVRDTSVSDLNGNVTLTLRTRKEGVCPQATKTIDLKIEPYPQFDFLADPEIQCEPALVNFEALVSKPFASSNLRYTWWFGQGDTILKSTTFNPKNVKYDTAKRTWYDVTLIVDNQWGSGPDQACSIRKDSIGYVKILPQPKVGYSSDPGFFTTVAFPKFKFFNETKVRWTSPGEMSYLWHFGSDDPEDTSTQYNPIHSYTADTNQYYVHLTATYTYFYKGEEYTCWDTISQLRKIGPDVTVFVPTAFSPEGTGPKANNGFRAIVNGEKTFHIELYNRWGERLWETDDKFESWDGKYKGEDAQQDVYAWFIKVTAYDGEEYTYEGTVTLLR
ncbi:MAG: gliding motility-associated C-terminal domain-containing protein, partial [Bacteroidia bacterium]|nr:gliding motility-associated C-terminal domain-containing protein [Bacteroidia bacterium]